MSQLLFIDSFDHYSTAAHMNRKWTSSANAIITVGRHGNGINTSNMGAGVMSFAKTFGPEYASLCMGMAYNMGSSSFAGQVMLLFNRRSVLNPLAIILEHVGDGRLNITFDGVTSPSTTTVLAENTWYYIELSVTLTKDGSNHVVVAYSLYFNGSPTPDITGTLTGTGSVGTEVPGIASIQPECGNLGGTLIDDLYVTDGENLGDVEIDALFPRLDGSSLVWTPSAAGTHFSLENEVDPDDFTTYVSSASIGDLDEYFMQTVGTGVIKGAQMLWCGTKSNSGVGSVKGSILSGATQVLDSEFFPSYASWLYERIAYRKSPFTSSDWTAAELNAMQQGMQRIS
jgi:hypothetical protein